MECGHCPLQHHPYSYCQVWQHLAVFMGLHLQAQMTTPFSLSDPSIGFLGPPHLCRSIPQHLPDFSSPTIPEVCGPQSLPPPPSLFALSRK